MTRVAVGTALDADTDGGMMMADQASMAVHDVAVVLRLRRGRGVARV